MLCSYVNIALAPNLNQDLSAIETNIRSHSELITQMRQVGANSLLRPLKWEKKQKVAKSYVGDVLECNNYSQNSPL